MQAFQSSKMAVPTLTSRAALTLRPQIRSAPATTTLSSFYARTYFSQQKHYHHKTLFSSIPTARPTLSSTLFNGSNNNNNNIATPLTTIDQIRSFSASASLAGKRATYNPSRRVQKRRHGFLARLKTRTGRLILKRRRLRGRKDLSW